MAALTLDAVAAPRSDTGARRDPTGARRAPAPRTATGRRAHWSSTALTLTARWRTRRPPRSGQPHDRDCGAGSRADDAGSSRAAETVARPIGCRLRDRGRWTAGVDLQRRRSCVAGHAAGRNADRAGGPRRLGAAPGGQVGPRCQVVVASYAHDVPRPARAPRGPPPQGLTLDRAIGLALCRRDVSERLHQCQDLLHRVTQAAPLQVGWIVDESGTLTPGALRTDRARREAAPAFGHTLCRVFSTQSAQNVHSYVQIRAFGAAGGRSTSHSSQLGRRASITPRFRFDPPA